MNIGILGSGEVAQVLGAGFQKHGHSVTLGTRDPSKLAKWAKEHAPAKVDSFAGAARFGELIVLAVKGSAAATVVRSAGPSHLSGKVVIDTTNPVTNAPPENGVLKCFTTLDESLMERLQHEFPDVHFVKAFSCVGADSMVDPEFAGGQPTMFIAGNEPRARETVAGILEQFGWEVADMGRAEAARAIEPLAVLWCIPGFLRNDWTHAFKVLR